MPLRSLSRRPFHLAILLMPLTGLSASAGVMTWDAVSQFGYNSNPSDPWSYGLEPQTLTGPDAPTPEPNAAEFSLLSTPLNSNGFVGWTTASSYPVVAVNTSNATAYGVAPGQLAIQPDNNEDAGVVRWTSPINGLVNIDGQFYPGDKGIMDVAVLVDGHETFSASDSGAFDQTVFVNAGDTVDFAVTEGPDGYNYGNTPLSATISAVPEPSSAVIALSGGAGLLIRRRRCR